MSGKVAFVSPRYGIDVVGGSEAVMREAAHGLAARGWSVDFLTTCARDHYTWRNEYEPGTTEVDGIMLHRFAVVPGKGGRTRAAIEDRIQKGEVPSLHDQLVWLDGLFRVPTLFDHLVDEADRYDAIVMSPYLFWTTIVGATVVPERTVLMPCLHDEAYVRLDLFRTLLAESGTVWFLSEPEHELAHRIASLRDHHSVTGAGVVVPTSYDAEGFRKRHGIERPFVLFAGRREGGKGWTSLLSAYRFALANYGVPLDLVTFGVGPVDLPPDLTGRVVDLGFLEDEEVPNAFAAATAYVQPSTNESFSRTVMESWLAGTPVIATLHSAVLKWHCERSGGGLLYADEFEFAQCLEFLAHASDAATEMAQRGRAYVLEHYRWETVLDRMEQSLREVAR